ncbi:hypothetical protein B0T14DRAFT_174384 [Immersiella caudata]|uniref:Uncharacterized protein n=1 Tax=Immersiella caudata TaxID=314043 RepID=A0AA40C365_9PEZI|nr:hypothetical protein B0T14DRAFT_174384 [Immersiella caudata]
MIIAASKTPRGQLPIHVAVALGLDNAVGAHGLPSNFLASSRKPAAKGVQGQRARGLTVVATPGSLRDISFPTFCGPECGGEPSRESFLETKSRPTTKCRGALAGPRTPGEPPFPGWLQLSLIPSIARHINGSGRLRNSSLWGLVGLENFGPSSIASIVSRNIMLTAIRQDRICACFDPRTLGGPIVPDAPCRRSMRAAVEGEDT